ncbi:MAG: hypothetical protein AAF485_25740, partial [Chloroflexota bacterium]
GKNFLTDWYPNKTLQLYLLDQIFHFISIGAVTIWFAQLNGNRLAWIVANPLTILIMGYLLVTYVWFITERVLAYQDYTYRQFVIEHKWSRMLARTLLLTMFLLSWDRLETAMIATPLLAWPYGQGAYQSRIIYIDLGLVLIVTIFVQLIL